MSKRVEPNRNVYVGHRYVPKIMGEWDKSIDYEGLSIVTHQGASYTSKKRVPVGIDILNEEFWVVTGNYNAQIEQYRQDVRNMESYVDDEVDSLTNHVNTEIANTNQHINDEVDSLTDHVNTNVTELNETMDTKVAKGELVINVKDFGAVGDGVTDDTDAIQNALDNGVNIFFPSGRYVIKKPLEINRSTHIKGNIRVYRSITMDNWNDGESLIYADRVSMFKLYNSSLIMLENIGLKGEGEYFVKGISSGDGEKISVNINYSTIHDFNIGIDLTEGAWLQKIRNSYIGSNDIGILAPYGFYNSEISSCNINSNRIGIDAKGTQGTIRYNHFGINSDTDEIALRWNGATHDITSNYFENYNGTGQANNGDGTIPIYYIVNRFDEPVGKIENNNMNMKGHAKNGIYITQTTKGSFTTNYTGLEQNKIIGVTESQIFFEEDANLRMVVPDYYTVTNPPRSILPYRNSMFRGLLVRLNESVSLEPGVETPIKFNDVLYDTENIYNAETQTITIPTRFTRVRVTCSLNAYSLDEGFLKMKMYAGDTNVKYPGMVDGTFLGDERHYRESLSCTLTSGIIDWQNGNTLGISVENGKTGVLSILSSTSYTNNINFISVELIE